MKKTLAFTLTVVILGAGIWFSYRQRNTTPEEPESVIWLMLEKSKAGDVEGYLDCFSGQTRAQLETTAQGMSLPKFSEYLKQSVAPVKGVAVYDVQRPSEVLTTLVVEYVYQDQNERQQMSLKKDKSRWRIEKAEASQRIQPIIPYGKPVTDGQ